MRQRVPERPRPPRNGSGRGRRPRGSAASPGARVRRPCEPRSDNAAGICSGIAAAQPAESAPSLSAHAHAPHEPGSVYLARTHVLWRTGRLARLWSREGIHGVRSVVPPLVRDGRTRPPGGEGEQVKADDYPDLPDEVRALCKRERLGCEKPMPCTTRPRPLGYRASTIPKLLTLPRTALPAVTGTVAGTPRTSVIPAALTTLRTTRRARRRSS